MGDKSNVRSSTSVDDLSQRLKNAATDGFMAQDVSDLLVHNLSDQTLQATTQAVDPSELDTEQVTLVQFVLDASSSMTPHRQAMVDAMRAIVKDLQGYKQSDQMLVSAWQFDSSVKLLFAAKKIADVTNDFDQYTTGGYTVLYDGVKEALAAGRTYAQELMDEDYQVRMIVIILTDGEDTGSNSKPSDSRALAQAMTAEEVAILALVAFQGPAQFDAKTIANDLAIPNVMEEDWSDDDAVHASIKKLTGLISQSVIRASQTTVGASQNSFFDA